MGVLAQQCDDFTETKLQRYPTACASHKKLLYSTLHLVLVKAAGLDFETYSLYVSAVCKHKR